MRKKRVLGIDPGLRLTGYGIVDEEGGKLIAVDYSVLKVKSHLSLGERLRNIYDGLTRVIAKCRPTEVAVEMLFFSKNVNSAIKLGEARGAAIIAAAQQGVWVYEYTPTQIKQAVCGYGHSTKEQVQKMVCVLLGIHNLPQEKKMWDVTDALAIAICHIHSSKWLEKLSEGGKQ